MTSGSRVSTHPLGVLLLPPPGDVGDTGDVGDIGDLGSVISMRRLCRDDVLRAMAILLMPSNPGRGGGGGRRLLCRCALPALPLDGGDEG